MLRALVGERALVLRLKGAQELRPRVTRRFMLRLLACKLLFKPTSFVHEGPVRGTPACLDLLARACRARLGFRRAYGRAGGLESRGLEVLTTCGQVLHQALLTTPCRPRRLPRLRMRRLLRSCLALLAVAARVLVPSALEKLGLGLRLRSHRRELLLLLPRLELPQLAPRPTPLVQARIVGFLHPLCASEPFEYSRVLHLQLPQLRP